MNNNRPEYHQDIEQCVEALLSRVGKKVVLTGGFGRPILLFNELFRRAKADSSLQLTFMTMTMNRPKGSSDMEKRFLDPFVERVFGNMPNMDFVDAYVRQQLPKNVEVVELFMPAGLYLNNPHGQSNYVYSNFTHWFREMFIQGCNVFGQGICKKTIDGELVYSLSADACTLDAVHRLKKLQKEGKNIVCFGHVNQELPFMYNDALVAPAMYDMVLDNPAYYHTPLASPSPPVDITDYLIGLNASALIKDGGTLQIGIGSLGDAITYGCCLRHQQNAHYKNVLSKLGILQNYGGVIETVGNIEPFSEGLYGSTEMFADGFRHLFERGILKREVYNDIPIQRLINERKIGKEVTPSTLDRLLEEGAISPKLTQQDFDYLQKFGILKDALDFRDGNIHTAEGEVILADLTDNKASEQIRQSCLGAQLQGGIVLHGGFFLGPPAMYEALRNMPEAEAKKISMTDIAFVNQLYGQEELAILQRQHARFINTTIMMSLLGAACSDGLEDSRRISGVGGQYNFVAMAHALEGARSVLMLRSTRTKGEQVTSNIVWNYGHATIPAHLRDIVVTEYGIVDLRGQRDKDVIAALINIADSRFQNELLAKAKSAGKIPPDYEIPSHFRNNTPERLAEIVNGFKTRGLFPTFPFGTDFTREELVLGEILKSMKAKMDSKMGLIRTLVGTVEAAVSIPDAAKPYLKRMGLDKPKDLKEMAIQKVLVAELKAGGYT